MRRASSWTTGSPGNPWKCSPRTSASTCSPRGSIRRSKGSARPRSSRSASCQTKRSRSGAPSSRRSSRSNSAASDGSTRRPAPPGRAVGCLAPETAHCHVPQLIAPGARARRHFRSNTMEIRIQGVSKRYFSEGKTITALDDVNLTIPANQIFTLLGPSGCGKTTLLRCIVGLETPDSGEIRIGDEVVWSREQGIAVPPEKRGLGMVFQTYAIWPHMNVFDNVAYPLQVRRLPGDVIRQKVEKTLRFVRLEGFEKRPSTKLSGGQQQRVALARALVAEPKVILFDEPLSNLDAKLREETRKELRGFLRELKITAVYVTHDRIEALVLSDLVAVMRSGQIVEMGSPKKIYFDADTRFVADFIGRANLVKAKVRGEEGGYTMVECGLGTIAR